MTKNRQNKGRSVEKDNSGKATANRRSKTGRATDQGFRHGAISIFILFHLIAITFWAVPWNVSVVRDVREVIRPYMLWSGLFQSWDMFAPNPKPVNGYIKAVVITDDRHLKVWTFPRMEELSLWQRYRKERYRKFVEVLPNPESEILWPAVAGHAAWLFDPRPSDPPAKVMLIQFRADIPPEGQKAHEPEPNVFYDDYVDPGDLR